MTEYLIEVLSPLAGHVPDNGTDESGNTYTDWALADSASFTFTLPYGFTTGTDIVIVINETTPGSSKNHKWTLVTTVNSTYTETHTSSFTASATAWAIATRSITCSTSGSVGAHALVAGDMVSIAITRAAADSNEDSNHIRIYTITAHLTSVGGVSTCLGRLGNIVNAVLMRFNDNAQKFINQAEVIQWVNDCQLLIAQRGFWHKTTEIDLVANQQQYNLWTLIADIENVEEVSWGSGSDYTYQTLPAIGNWGTFQRLSVGLSTGTPQTYHIQGNLLYLLPTPDTSVVDGLAIRHTYCPTNMSCTSNYTPSTPAAHDEVYVFFALSIAFRKDRHSPMAAEQAGYYEQKFQQALGGLSPTAVTPIIHLRGPR